MFRIVTYGFLFSFILNEAPALNVQHLARNVPQSNSLSYKTYERFGIFDDRYVLSNSADVREGNPNCPMPLHLYYLAISLVMTIQE